MKKKTRGREAKEGTEQTETWQNKENDCLWLQYNTVYLPTPEYYNKEEFGEDDEHFYAVKDGKAEMVVYSDFK